MTLVHAKPAGLLLSVSNWQHFQATLGSCTAQYISSECTTVDIYSDLRVIFVSLLTCATLLYMKAEDSRVKFFVSGNFRFVVILLYCIYFIQNEKQSFTEFLFKNQRTEG